MAVDIAERLLTRRLDLIDHAGKTRLLLDTSSGQPVMSLWDSQDQPRLTITIDAADMASIEMSSPFPDGPTLRLEMDEKGSHLMFEHPGGANGYLFLNNEGRSGLVLNDAAGKRGFGVTLATDGTLAAVPNLSGGDHD